MTLFFDVYLSLWILACLFSIFLFLKEKASYVLGKAEYFRFLFKPWKLATFVLATTGLTVIAPYTGDPTWDYFDALFMAVLTFLTAPWAVGTLYQVIRRRLPMRQAFVACCAWMFSASWSYDLYLVLRDGHYPLTWYANIFASSVLYLSAGLLWSLEWRKDRGVIFGFMEEDWPGPSTDRDFMKILWFALPFMVLVALIVLSFFLPILF